jgi:hypothetical protein
MLHQSINAPPIHTTPNSTPPNNAPPINQQFTSQSTLHPSINQEQPVPTNDTIICHDLAKHGFPNVRTPTVYHHVPYLPVVREYARVLKPEERIHVAEMVPVQLLEGT